MKAWKYVVAVGMTIVISAGFLIHIPQIPILEETARNIFFHVPMWMTMFVLFLISFWYSIKYLNEPNMDFDVKASSAASVGVAFGICGL